MTDVITPDMMNDHLTTVGQFPRVFSPEECAGIIALPVPQQDALVDILEGGDPHRNLTARRDYGIRNTRIKSLPPGPGTDWIFQRLRRLADAVNQQAFRFRLIDLMSLDVLEYGKDGFFDWHTDIGGGEFSTRKLTIVTALTPPDQYTGGDLNFADGGEALRLPQGTTVIFPSYLVHKVYPVTGGMRHTLVSFIHGPAFN